MRLRNLSACLAIALVTPLACSGESSKKTSEPTTPAVVVAPPPADPEVKPAADPTPGPEVEMAARGDAKALSDTIKKGLAWLAKHEAQGGGWGQGDEAPGMRGSTNVKMRDTANVADTSMAVIAFLRAGQSPRAGEYQDTVNRGIEFVLSEIEKSDETSLAVTSISGTRVQSKIGPYADTFAALMMLTEAKDKMRDGIANARLDAALKKVVKKVEKNQRANGSWDEKGWAPVLSQALAAKGLNRASARGYQVNEQVLLRVEEQAAKGDMSSRGSAGVEVYGSSAKNSGLRDSVMRKKANVDKMKAAKAKADNANKSPEKAPTAAEIAAAEADMNASHKQALDSERQMIARLEDPRFVQGFGNNGGEEYLSYLLISETLVQRGGDEWKRWDAAITKLVDKVQNEDGSWTGHHCITGRTFCTAAALLVLMGDRTPATTVIAK
jgi:hypothetical protein